MIFYNHDREVMSEFVRYKPRTCFIMTQLGGELSDEVKLIRSSLSTILNKHEVKSIDANSYVTGKDFLSKIWKMIHAVPFGIAIVSEDMKLTTVSNIFYEIGVMNALGKETIVVKTPGFKIPSDFVRTEYVEFNGDFEKRIDNFINTTLDLVNHYDDMADLLEENPNLSIDYWRRAFMICGDPKFIRKAEGIYDENKFDTQSRLFCKSLFKNKGEAIQRIPELTEREQEIVDLISDGLSASEIAEMKYISIRTVENHRHNIHKKLKAKNSIDLINKLNKHKVMAYYRVNKNKQANGDNEVHKRGCTYYDGLTNYEALGDHDTCSSAVNDAKNRGYQADGCAICIPSCHTS